ncbi:MAG: hypothetical protein IKD59_05490 [Lachnospiraceae bacterium]|nr:hypothetical protein [Lachnospiraceae bacterium]
MKAIIIIDMPKNCGECPCVNDEFGFCQADEKIRDCDWYKSPTWCPLKPMPKCRYYRGNERDFTDGFNTCLKEITGETE